MTFVTLLLIAIGVSADAFAVALGKGLGMRRLNYRHAVLIALAFGVFQAVMPLVGWLVGTQFQSLITSIDHWIAFGLLALVGGKMLYEAFSKGGDEKEDDGLRVRELLLLSFATSIDALAVGISFAFLEVDILPAVALIGATTAVLSFAAVLIGHRAGTRFKRPAEIAGGLILIGIGTKILFDHLLP